MAEFLALARGLGLGLSLAAPPGAVSALVAREAGRHGFGAGVRAGIPAPIVDTAYLCAVLFGVRQFVDLEAFTVPLSAIGAALMAYLAWDTVRHRATPPAPAGRWAVWAVTLTNPFQYAWWLSAGAVLVIPLGPWGIAGFLMAIYGWVVVFSFLVAHGAARWSWFAPFLEVLSADLLLAFALQLGYVASAGL
ncbi:MAG: LysE family transporter [Thermoplasmatota archaeon]|nr:LysE family translocator [Halobacteriales archaeon]